MADILDNIIADKRIEVAQRKAMKPMPQLLNELERGQSHRVVSMRRALLTSESGIIAEFKRRSPSKGWINRDADPVSTASGYASAGAAAISVLTDEKYFGGSLDYLRTIRSAVDVPLLRKEFVVDEYQLVEARLAGADAVLLIASALSFDDCLALTATAHQLGLEVLLEIHGADELHYAETKPDMIGVNNRHLGTFHTDVAQSFAMAAKLPEDAVLVSESGISDADTVRRLRRAGFRGFLIGETFMRQPAPEAALQQLIVEMLC
ncbi:MAG: indole-3-glycerol phosphate synthase TrpC [Muribaculaceae bacterium]